MIEFSKKISKNDEIQQFFAFYDDIQSFFLKNIAFYLRIIYNNARNVDRYTNQAVFFAFFRILIST